MSDPAKVITDLDRSGPANARQVGGSHYKRGGEEHWDRQWRLHGRGYFVGNVTAYVERYHLKNGLEDLDKAIHYLQKLRELEAGNVPTLSNQVPLPQTASDKSL